VQASYADIRQLGGEVLVVSFAAPRRVAVYLARYPLPFRAVSDPARAAYQAFALGRTSWPAMLRAGVVGRYLKLLFRGWRLDRPDRGEDIMQLGGDFVLDGQRRLVYAYRSAEPTDRPPASALVEAVRSATG
jgi:hypothetical protein